jgi:galactokinase
MSIEAIVKTKFHEQFGQAPAIVVRAPGRVNLLGEHVDYSEGWALPAAIDRAIWLAARPTDTQTVVICALDHDERQQFNLDQLERGLGMGSWLAYPAGVAWALMQADHALTGMEVVFGGDIPIGAGVSSSAAVEIAFILAWETFSHFNLSGIERARFGQRVENAYLGLQSGVMDQFASLHGAADHALLLDCRDLSHSLVALPADSTLVIADSGVRRELIHSEYNRRQEECAEAVRILRAHLPQIQTLRDVTPELLELTAHWLPLDLRRRAQHVVGECDRVLTGVETLRQGNVGEFGLKMRQSHVSLRDLYEVSIPELDWLAVTAWQTPGCYGARLMGAGFGGCVLALARDTAVADLQFALESSFEQEFGRLPNIFTCRLADGAAVHLVGEG